MSEKYDVFVGNLTFNTTEEQLREKFEFVGPVKNIRILTDKETGKPKGFAFVEYYDTNTALSAIRHLDQVELNGRKLKVGYPSNSNLKDIARQIGQIAPEDVYSSVNTGLSSTNAKQLEQQIVNSLKLHEAWDLLEAMKQVVTNDNNRGLKVRALLESHPQLISAMYEIQRKLGIQIPNHTQTYSTIANGPNNNMIAFNNSSVDEPNILQNKESRFAPATGNNFFLPPPPSMSIAGLLNQDDNTFRSQMNRKPANTGMYNNNNNMNTRSNPTAPVVDISQQLSLAFQNIHNPPIIPRGKDNLSNQNDLFSMPNGMDFNNMMNTNFDPYRNPYEFNDPNNPSQDMKRIRTSKFT